MTNQMQLIECSLLLSVLYMFRRFFHPSSGAYKTVYAALGIFMLSCCLPLVWMGWNHGLTAGKHDSTQGCTNRLCGWVVAMGSKPSTPAVDSRKA
jgi:hypothetical protein